MGHHPPIGQQIPTREVVSTGGISPAGWFLIIIGILIIIIILYFIFKKKY